MHTKRHTQCKVNHNTISSTRKKSLVVEPITMAMNGECLCALLCK